MAQCPKHFDRNRTIVITGPRLSSDGKRAADKTATSDKRKLMKITVLKSGETTRDCSI